MPLIVARRDVGPVTLLELGERLTADAAAELQEKVDTLIAEGRKELLLDCSRIRVIDSRGLGTLVREGVTTERSGGHLKLVRLSPTLRDALTATRLITIFESFDDLAVALRSFSA